MPHDAKHHASGLADAVARTRSLVIAVYTQCRASERVGYGFDYWALPRPTVSDARHLILTNLQAALASELAWS